MKSKIPPIIIAIALLLTACQQAEPVATETVTQLPESVSPQVEPSATPNPIEDQMEEFVPTFRGSPCPFTVPASHIEGDTVQCGFVIVPEDHSVPPSIRDTWAGINGGSIADRVRRIVMPVMALTDIRDCKYLAVSELKFRLSVNSKYLSSFHAIGKINSQNTLIVDVHYSTISAKP